MSIVDKIIWEPLPDDQYVKEETAKTTIYLHHTAGSSDPDDVETYWKTSAERVATHFVIGGWGPEDGKIVQGYNTKYWGYHLGLHADQLPAGSKTSVALNSGAIAIELCNWGQLEKTADGHFKNYAGGTVPANQVVDLGFKYRGFQFWHAYTDNQIANLKEMLLFFGSKFGIPLTFKGMEMFDLDMRAFKGEPGVWSHVSVRRDKEDCSPQPKLLEMLKSL